MQELEQKIAKLEANSARTPMQEAILDKLKKQLEKGVSQRNTSAPEPKSMFFSKKDNLKIENIRLEAIEPNPYQPRRHFRETEIVDLATSIKKSGLIEPIVITRWEGKTTLVAGQKRLKAYQYLHGQEEEQGLEPIEMQYISIPCFAIEIQQKAQLAILSITENMARENPLVIDTAQAIKTLFGMLRADDSKLSQNKFSEMAKEYFGIKSKGTISKYLQIAEINKEVQDEIFKQQIDSFTELYLLAKSELSVPEQKSLIQQNALSTLNTIHEKKENLGEVDGSDKIDVEEGEDNLEKKAPLGSKRGKETRATKKSKSKIDIRYLIDTIKNLAVTTEEDKPRLEEELLEYLSEFED